MHRALSRLLRATGIAADVAVLLFILMLEDCTLWFVPRAVSGLDVWTFKARCAEIKPGISRGQALEIMHQGVVPWYENEYEHLPPGEGSAAQRGMDFYGGNGVCRVWLDPTGQSVTSVKFERPGPMTVVE